MKKKLALFCLAAVAVLAFSGCQEFAEGFEEGYNNVMSTSSHQSTITTNSTSDSATVSETNFMTASTSNSASPSTTTTTTASALTTAKANPKIVYWGHTGEKLHIDPNCRTIKNGALSGSLDEAKAAGHSDWCQVCSKGWSDEKFLESGNPYAE